MRRWVRYLHDVEHAELAEASRLGVVQLRALDDHRVGGQVHAPRQRRSAHQHLHPRNQRQPGLERGVTNSERLQRNSDKRSEAKVESDAPINDGTFEQILPCKRDGCSPIAQRQE
jgi:hypothetical protein